MQYTACVGWDSRPVGMWYLLAQKLRALRAPSNQAPVGCRLLASLCRHGQKTFTSIKVQLALNTYLVSMWA